MNDPGRNSFRIGRYRTYYRIFSSNFFQKCLQTFGRGEDVFVDQFFVFENAYLGSCVAVINYQVHVSKFNVWILPKDIKLLA